MIDHLRADPCVVKPADQALGMLPEMVVSVETMIRFFNPQQVLFPRSQRIEDCLTISLCVDKEVSPKLRHQRRHSDVFRVG